MTFEVETFEDLVTEMKINLVDNIDEINDLNVGSVLDIVISTFASSLAGLYEELDTVYEGSQITTSTGDDLEEIGLIVGIERDAGSYASGYVTFNINTALSSNMTIPLNSQVSTQPNTTETQLVYNVTAATIFQASVTGEEQEFINGIYDYKLNQRFFDSISSLSGTSGAVAYVFVETTDFDIVEDFDGDIIDVDDYAAFNLCEAITNWTASDHGDAVALDGVTYYEGSGSLQLSKTDVAAGEILMTYKYSIGVGNEIDIGDKSLFMDLYIKDVAALAKILTVEVAYSSTDTFTTAGVSYTYDADDLAVGWNLLKVDPDGASTTTTGNVDTENIKDLMIKVTTVVNTDTFAGGDLNIDNWIFSTYTAYEGDIVRFDYSGSNLPDTTTDISVSYVPLSWEIPIKSASVGVDYNVSQNAITYKVSSFPLIRTISNYLTLTGGIDEEIDATLKDRILNASELANVATKSAIENNVQELNYVETCTVNDMPEEYVTLESHVYDDTSKKFQLTRYIPTDDASLAVFETYDQLDGDISVAVVTIVLDSAASFSATGNVQIEGEIISYTGKTGTDLTGCTRGILATIAATHDDNTIVTQYEYINGTDYDLNTDYEIVFTGAGSEPADGTTVYANYNRDKLGYFEVYVTGLDGELNATQITNIEDYVEDDLKSAGMQFKPVLQPTYITMDVELTVTYLTGYTEALLEDDMEDAVREYINALKLGDDVLLAQIINGVMNITGVSNVSVADLSDHAGAPGIIDFVIAADEKAIMGTLTYT